MNTTALAIIQADELETIQRTAKLLAASGYFGTSEGITGMAQVAAKIMAGRELGFGPFASVNGIHIIQGKPTVGANLMAAAVRAHPRYDYRVKELSDTACELEFFDGGKPAGTSRFTKAEAETAGLSNGKNATTWQKFPRNMLFARAMSNGVRWYAPDIFSGNAVYVPEELGAEVDGDGSVIDVTPSIVVEATQTGTVARPTSNGTTTAANAPYANGDEPVQVENPFNEPSEAAKARIKMNELGESLYGEDWPKVCRRNVSRITNGYTEDIKDLTIEQVQTLITGMTKLADQRQPA